jgi:hypothetical protein
MAFLSIVTERVPVIQALRAVEGGVHGEIFFLGILKHNMEHTYIMGQQLPLMLPAAI